MSQKTCTLFGFHGVEAALQNPARNIRQLWATEKTENWALEQLQRSGKRIKPTIQDKKWLDKRLKGAVHQGIAAIVDPLPELTAADLAIKASQKGGRQIIAILDQVTDPHNIGAILRSAAAFDLDGLILQTRYAPELDGVLAKVACGGLEHMPIALETNLSRACEALQSHGFQGLAMDEHAPETLASIQLPDKLFVILGAEGKGIRPSVKEKAAHTVRLDCPGGVKSLNVSNAAAIVFYALS